MVIADGSSYNFVPDALIQTGIKYDILPASKLNQRRIHNLTVAGSTCDAWDILVGDISLPKIQSGDLLAIMDVGAYAQVMSSNFNTMKRAPVVMIDEEGRTRMIRRRDRYSEMFAPELDMLKIAGPDELEKYNNIYRVNIDNIWKGKLAAKHGKK